MTYPLRFLKRREGACSAGFNKRTIHKYRVISLQTMRVAERAIYARSHNAPLAQGFVIARFAWGRDHASCRLDLQQRLQRANHARSSPRDFAPARTAARHDREPRAISA